MVMRRHYCAQNDRAAHQGFDLRLNQRGCQGFEPWRRSLRPPRCSGDPPDATIRPNAMPDMWMGPTVVGYPLNAFTSHIFAWNPPTVPFRPRNRTSKNVPFSKFERMPLSAAEPFIRST